MKRLFFDLFALLIGAGASYLVYVISMSIESFEQWDRYIILIVLAIIAGLLVGFFAFKTEGLIISSIMSAVLLIILIILGINGIGMAQSSGNYILSLVVYIVIGVVFLSIMLLSTFLGHLLAPKLWKVIKGEIKQQTISEKDNMTLTLQERMFCEVCGSEIPFDHEVCTICGSKVKK